MTAEPFMLPPQPWLKDCIATPDDQYRLWLSRETVDVPNDVTFKAPAKSRDMVVGLMLNPSKARGEGIADPTQRKWNGFALRLGARRYGFLNLFSYSTPYPEELFTGEPGAEMNEAQRFLYAVGKYNDAITYRIFKEAAAQGWPVICGWGKPNLPKAQKALLLKRLERVLELWEEFKPPLYCFAETPDGWPRHPLMLSYDYAKLEPWSPARIRSHGL